MNKFEQISYQRHKNTYNISNFSDKRMYEKDTVDWWRHKRMYKTIDGLIDFFKDKKWLTIGDGNYGEGARYLLKHGVKEVIATDISITFLKKAKDLNYIKEYQEANAENLPFADNSFDLTFVKESYHHFPRPMIALYEMLRVSKEAVVLIEPNDPFSKVSPIRSFFRLGKKMIGKGIQRHHYEKIGNYVYTISRREIEKVALGLNYKTLAFKGINDHYIKGGGDERMKENGPIKNKISKTIKIHNFLCKIGFTDYALLTAIIFKKQPPEELINKLKEQKYEIILLPDNPYCHE